MKRLEAFFFHTEMTWKRVILLSVVCAVVIGLLMIPEFLQDTSFQMPGITFEFWILFALFIVLNCKTPLEAGVKTFVAFLISQPLIYLVQVPFSWRGWELFSYYPRWFIFTLLTFPGAMLAWFVKKNNLWSVLILSIANLILCYCIVHCTFTLLESFPHLLLTVLFMLAEVIIFILLLFPDAKKRILAFSIAGILLVGSLFIQLKNKNNLRTSGTTIEAGTPPFTVLSENDPFEVSFQNDLLRVTYRPSDTETEGSQIIRYSDAEGTVYQAEIVYGNGSLDFAEE